MVNIGDAWWLSDTLGYLVTCYLDLLFLCFLHTKKLGRSIYQLDSIPFETILMCSVPTPLDSRF